MDRPWKYRAPAIGWGFLIIYLSLAPADDLENPLSFEISDKVVHFIMYFTWVAFLYFGSARGYRKRLTKGKLSLYWIGAIAIGGVMELLQGAMALGRHADWEDAVANSIGATSALLLSIAVHRLMERFLENINKQ